MSDPINHPAHYTKYQPEVIEIIEAWDLGYHLGNVLKYVLRAPYNGSEREDLQKALWYTRRFKKIFSDELYYCDEPFGPPISRQDVIDGWRLTDAPTVASVVTVIHDISTCFTQKASVIRALDDIEILLSGLIAHLGQPNSSDSSTNSKEEQHGS